jgi:phage terminase large subunit-like protein
MPTAEIARVFTPLLMPARYKAIYGGRGSGKSHVLASLLIAVAYRMYRQTGKGLRAVGVREVQKTLDQSVKRLIEEQLEALSLGPEWTVTRTEVRTPGGGVILFQGMQDHNAQSIKSLENMNVAWVEEAQTLTERSFELLRPTIRADGSEIWCSWNPRHPDDAIDQFFRGVQQPPMDAIIIKANYSDNPWFPAPLEIERQHDLQHNTNRYGHIWLGDYEPIAVGAIFNTATLHATRVHGAPPPLARIGIGVDPAVSSTAKADEHGIVVAAVGQDGHGYVLEDASTRGAPDQWGRRVVETFDKWRADFVVIERNQGGDMVRHVLDTIRPALPVREVTATRGKHVRAEPIAALYETQRIHHVGTLSALEIQLSQITASGYEGVGSPDRADALVWVLSELFPQLAPKAGPTRIIRSGGVVA